MPTERAPTAGSPGIPTGLSRALDRALADYARGRPRARRLLARSRRDVARARSLLLTIERATSTPDHSGRVTPTGHPNRLFGRRA
jgi:hypothetical protein